MFADGDRRARCVQTEESRSTLLDVWVSQTDLLKPDGGHFDNWMRGICGSVPPENVLIIHTTTPDGETVETYLPKQAKSQNDKTTS